MTIKQQVTEMIADAGIGGLAGSNRVPALARSINDHLGAADAASRRGLEHAIAAGVLPLEAKELVPHGEWLAWLEANCSIGVRQSQIFMRLAHQAREFLRKEALVSMSSGPHTIRTSQVNKAINVVTDKARTLGLKLGQLR